MRGRYDLPWNPKHLQQRKGRMDRYGPRARTAKRVLLYGQDNRIDVALLDVLIRKAAAIRGTLGVTVPIPVESGAVPGDPDEVAEP